MAWCNECLYPAGFHHPDCSRAGTSVPNPENYNVLVFPPVRVGWKTDPNFYESSGYRAMQPSTDAVGVGKTEAEAMLGLVRHARFRQTPFSRLCPICDWPLGFHTPPCPHNECGEVEYALHGCGPVPHAPQLTLLDIGIFPPYPPRTLWLAQQLLTKAWGIGDTEAQAIISMRAHANFIMPEGLQ